MVQEEYVFDDHQHQPKKSSGIGKFIWNSENREFLGRDGASWGKITLFYTIFYTCLGSFFIGLLALFIRFMPVDRPTYIGVDSTMSVRGINPGLGFRPQIDVEDHLISINPTLAEDSKYGFLKYVRNLENFLNAKYGPVPDEFKGDVIQCNANSSYANEMNYGKACEFEPEKEFKNTPCTKENSYGYNTNQPCVLVKLNKVYTYVPDGYPYNGINVNCSGETSADRDNLKGVRYYSIDGQESTVHGLLDKKFFPYMGQKAYRAPFIWVKFDVPLNTLVNIECRADVKNIDTADRMNRRGQTKFSLYITNKSN
ncbi:unnamed protein product [Brachionus calyciflorus]|uniref:Sodium/potassium-transporting ATPase subunit beta n=1 Tax=Brachionus calyciflorus TaxID=104777 RepID=A0A814ADW7_9BILA|nr:unnamed protein product [Brachionus calyciflorus]